MPDIGKTTPTQDKAIVSMLHQIIDLANIVKIRECSLRDIGSRMDQQGFCPPRPVPVQLDSSITIAVAPVSAAAPSSQPSGQTAPRQINGAV